SLARRKGRERTADGGAPRDHRSEDAGTSSDARPSRYRGYIEGRPKMSGLVLSLFPGIGLLDMAFEEEGFCIVRGPDLLWGGDIRKFHPPAGRFDGVIGG